MIMRTIVALLAFGLIWSERANAQMDGLFSPEGLACSNEKGFVECMQGFTDSFFRSGIWEKAQTLMNSQSPTVSTPSFSPQEFDQLCEIYSSTDQCFNRNEIRQVCGKNIAVKALDNVFGFMCRPENKKVFMDDLPCVQNLTATDPRMQRCNNNLMQQFGIDREDILGSGKPSIAALSNAMGNLCNILKSSFQCTEPIIVQNCGPKIFNLTVTLAENALEILSIDCDAMGPITNSTSIGLFGGSEQISGSNGPMGEIFSHLNLFCDANNAGLQECSLAFANMFSSPEWGSAFQNVFGSGSGSEDSFASTDGKFDRAKLDGFCNVSYDPIAGCMSRQNLVEVCPKASLVKFYTGIIDPMCSPQSKPKFAAAMECQARMAKKSGGNSTTGAECSRPGSFGLRFKRQLDSIFVDSQPNSGSENPFANLCDDMKNFIQCEKPTIVRECGQETFEMMVQISQGTVSILDESCDVAELGGKMQVNPPSAEGSCSPPKCAQRFSEASSRDWSPVATIHPGHFPGLSTEQYLQQCETADALRKCFDETDAWRGCEDDSSFKTIKNTLFAMCPASNRDVIANGIECLSALSNRDSNFHRCVTKFENATNNAELCSSAIDAYKCAKDPIVENCGAKIFAMMVNVTGSVMESTAPGCPFASNVDSNPNVGKKPESAVGELRGEVDEKSKENSAKIPVSSFIFLVVAAIFSFW